MGAGHFIQLKRLQARMSQARLAELIGFPDQSYVSKIERGARPLSFAEATRIANSLAFSLDELAAASTVEVTVDQAWARVHAAIDFARAVSGGVS